MKKTINLLLYIILFSLFITNANAACDQIFENNFLRYDYSYRFFDEINNNTDRNIYLNTWQVNYTNPNYLDRGTTHPNGQDWDWTQTVKNSGYTVNPNTEGLRILQTNSNDWRIANHPAIRTNATQESYDFRIEYIIGYDFSNNYPDERDDINISECAYYSVTWCGDGVIDDSYGEQCDEGVNNGDGISGCNATCTIEEEPQVCVSGGVTGVQNSAISALTPNLCPAGQTVGNFSSTTSGRTTTYTWTCDGLSGGNCGASFTSSGGGGEPICYDIFVNGSNITCLGDTTTRSFKVDCGNGDQLIGRSITNANGLQEYTFNCDYSVNPRATNPQCSVSQSSTITDLVNGWYSRLACIDTSGGGGGGGGRFCGNGVLETGEDCEKVINSDGSLGDFPPFCNSSCQFTGGGGGGAGETPFITIPNHGDLVFGPAKSTIIGHEVNPYEKISEKPYIYNDSDYDFSFDRLCVKYKEGSSLNYVNNLVCQDLPAILYPYQRVEFDAYPNFTGNKDLVLDGQSYADNILVTTLQEDGVVYDSAYFAANFNVRVSKPSIVTSGGGTSYVRDTSKIANINDVSTSDQNKNFAGVGVSTGDTSSFSDTTDDADIISDTQSDGDDYSGDLTTVTDEDGAASSTTTSLSDFENYNGIENVFILRNKNFRITSNYFSSLTGPRTYIVENANLYIDANISYLENIAFVVKGGNIVIDASVSSIKGTYITIEKDGVGGSITSWLTPTQLTIIGSLYGDVTRLVDNRHYIEETDGSLSVGTIVSFGSALFTRPAPLVSQFITEYLNSQKVAK